MEDEELKEYVQKQLHKKGIDIRTQDYITEYIHINRKLFANIIKPNKIVDRILNNLESSIKAFNDEKYISTKQRIFWYRYIEGAYSPEEKRTNSSEIK